MKDTSEWMKDIEAKVDIKRRQQLQRKKKIRQVFNVSLMVCMTVILIFSTKLLLGDSIITHIWTDTPPSPTQDQPNTSSPASPDNDVDSTFPDKTPGDSIDFESVVYNKIVEINDKYSDSDTKIYEENADKKAALDYCHFDLSELTKNISSIVNLECTQIQKISDIDNGGNILAEQMRYLYSDPAAPTCGQKIQIWASKNTASGNRQYVLESNTSCNVNGINIVFAAQYNENNPAIKDMIFASFCNENISVHVEAVGITEQNFLMLLEEILNTIK